MALAGLVVVWTALAYACAVEDENPATNRNRDAGTSGEAGGGEGGGSEGGTNGAPICAKYGGYDNVKVIAQAILTRVSQDCRIQTPVTRLNSEAAQHMNECFEIQLGGAFQCPGIKYESNVTVDSLNRKCRDMTRAHQGLNLRDADFKAYVENVTAELTAAGLTPDELAAMARFFEGTKVGVVQQQTQPTRNTYCTCENGVYDGKPCTVDAGVVDAGNDAADAADGDGG